MKNRIFAIPAAAPAMVVKPSTAAMIATMKNVKAQESIKTSEAHSLSTGSPVRASALLPRLEPETRDHSSGSRAPCSTTLPTWIIGRNRSARARFTDVHRQGRLLLRSADPARLRFMRIAAALSLRARRR